MTIAGTPPDRAPDPAAPLPRPVVLGIAGAASIVAVIVLAIAVRSSPFPDLDEAKGSTSASGTSRTAVTSNDEDEDEDEPRAAPVAGNSRELRTRLSKEVRGGKLKDATATLESLVAVDPHSPDDADVRGDIVDLASKAGFAGGAEADKVFDLIRSKMGERGPDILYYLVTSKGGSKAAERAAELLKQDEVRSRGTPAMRIAFDLKTAKSCDDKAALIDRARDEGDSRALGWLMLMSRSCRMSKDPKLKEAIAALKSR
ncbi:hypothetical protein [Polyangium spumosum]|uniref:Uncharacterized protein n=1 Tax=Polyangium spumosum TaxID=889282 RepID=A0A6N7Q1W3_9BACT|nr:hypothetical protein [Polyangium spumosum]MRG97186.1 hypothetical protein [Polyangium spumosum]